MKKLRKRQFRRTVGAIAIVGALLNVWVLAVHVTSAGARALAATAELHVAICHDGGVRYVPLSNSDSGKSGSENYCPICSGLAALHVAVVSGPDLNIAPTQDSGFKIAQDIAQRVIDRRLLTIFNRGPPLAA